MNARDTMAVLGYAAMLDDTVDLRDDSHGMSGGDPVRTLLNEAQRLESEIARLKIAHLRRMADLAGIRANDVLRDPFRLASKCVCRSLRFARVQNGCLAKIAELKESQCSTKS